MDYIIIIIWGVIFGIAATWYEIKNERGSTTFGFLSGAFIVFSATSYLLGLRNRCLLSGVKRI